MGWHPSIATPAPAPGCACFAQQSFDSGKKDIIMSKRDDRVLVGRAVSKKFPHK
jgi:hypothetical protein